jgi:hypothetical protein
MGSLTKLSQALICAAGISACATGPQTLKPDELRARGWVRFDQCRAVCDADADLIVVCGIPTALVVGRCERERMI